MASAKDVVKKGQNTPTAARSASQLSDVESLIDKRLHELKVLQAQHRKIEVEHNRVTKTQGVKESKLESVLLRIKAQCDSLLVREQDRLTKAVERINHTKIRASRITGTSETFYKKGFFDKGEVLTSDVRSIDKFFFGEIQSTDIVVYPDIEKFHRLRNDLVNAQQRFAKIKKILGTGPKTISVDPLLPQGLSSLIIQRNELSKGLDGIIPQTTASKLMAAQKAIDRCEAQIQALRVKAASLQKSIVIASAKSKSAPARVILQWSDAEELARDYLIWLGNKGVRCTGAGADGGVDVESPNLVAQVKMHNKPTGRPEIQRLFGIAAVEKKEAFFFAMSFSNDAKAWAEKAGVALFQFRRDGSVLPLGAAAIART